MASIKLLLSSRLARMVIPRTNENKLLTRLQVNGINRVSTAGICHKDNMDPVVKSLKPKPFPYKEKRYRSYMYLLPGGSTVARFDENTVIVSIEGLPGSGKTKFAKKFAEATDMYHQPKANFDFYYIRPDGFDLRRFNPIFFEEAQYPDIDLFLEKPKHPKIGRMQCEMYRLKYFFYIEAMAHLFNTGQGIVTERTPWSDQVFMDALVKCGFTNKDHERFYARMRHNSQVKLWRPHLVIYIDTPIETAMKNIKKRNNPREVNSPVWKSDFLKCIDESYKNKIIPEYDEHAYVLVYPYKDELDVNAILSDIEKMDFWPCLSNEKLYDWRISDDGEVSEWRVTFTNEIETLMAKCNLPSWDCEGYDYSPEAEQIQMQSERSLATPYWPGFDPDRYSMWELAFKRENKYWADRAMNLFPAYSP
ncbi:NADH dehydrogenase [ubiquinone] 1 alpha subcomplex subunit 10, mitochondrial-like [Panonychus citri]|uniref:NADH dehydrogenase [ubiquinone] 1 alpha subcomplex subunit 10, mitochondrial-like n=1 Tax=Panonychus citri TaxID=50023 RepID=UPI002307BA07|nr:NADH dehydrogenase [ubiquinone] 1 alpha subcomplex subunit 10, mitochondrial-like [Panonychus citri]